MKINAVIVLLLCNLLSTSVYGQENVLEQGMDSAVEVSAINGVESTSFSDWAWDVLWEIVEYIGSNWYTSEPVRSIAANRIELTTGSMSFNSSSDNIGNMVRIDVEANSVTTAVDMDITVKATCSFVAALNHTMSVILTHEASNTDVLYTNLGYNGMAAYAIHTQAMTGNYNARYVTDEEVTWDCGIIIYDNNVGGGGGGNTEEPQSNGPKRYITNSKEKVQYLVPSGNHKNSKYDKIAEIQSVDKLYTQMYDKEKENFVYQFSDYDIGDTIVVTDVVDKVYYDEKYDKTVLEFSTRYGNAEWPFDGDITKEFHKGDELTFQFKIVEEYSENGIVLENTDYAKIAMKKNVLGKACKEGIDIYDYLVVD